MKLFIVGLGTLLGLLIGMGLETIVFVTTGQVFPPVITTICVVVGFGFGLAYATRTRRPHQPIDPARYPNRIVSRRPR